MLKERVQKGSNAPDGAGSIWFKGSNKVQKGSNAPDGAGSIWFKGSKV
jgi:hypothetical protein